MHQVIDWQTGQIYGRYDSLAKAKRECRKLGHTGEVWAISDYHPPVAYVGDMAGFVVYNPRFRVTKGGHNGKV